MGKHTSRFLVKQRSVLKGVLIVLSEENRLYGLEYKKTIYDELKMFGYKPNHSEIYKSLHELLEEGVLKRIKKIKEGKKLQEVVYYVVDDLDKAKLYKKQLKVDLDRSIGLLTKVNKLVST